MDLTHKAAIVTGASSGIGEAIALALAGRQARVTLAARRVDRLEALATRVREAGGEALVLACDLRSEEAIVSTFARSHEHWGRTDVLVNNAGLGLKGPFFGGDTEAWRTMWEVNVLALMIATREALARFDGERGGHVVNVSSMAGHRVPPGGGYYAATKHAVRALTESLRQELRERHSPTRVSAVSPGFVETEFFDVFHEGDHERARETLSHYKVLEPGDVARAVLFALEAPAHVSIHDVLMRPTDQPT